MLFLNLERISGRVGSPVETVRLPQVHITVPARAAALAWLNAFTASGTDEDRPALYRTLSLEFFRDGVQMIGCNGHALFRTWVPVQPEEGDPAKWPDLDEAPTKSAVIMDPDSFGLGYMRTLLKVTGDESHAADELIITTAAADEEASLSLGTEFMSERLTLRACGQRTDLRLYGAAYPDWRRLRLGVEAIERLVSLTIGPRIFALVAKLKEVHAVDLEFYGKSKHIAFTARGDAEVRGLLMPMRKSTD